MEPSPNPERCEHLLDVLAELVARGGAGPLLAPPVVPGRAAFPDPWKPTRAGVGVLLRRLAWHAGNDRSIVVVDQRLGAPPTERKPETRVGLTAVTPKELHFRLDFLGDDDIAGTLAHELGVAHAAVNRTDNVDPYRVAEQPRVEVDVDRDLERGTIATVYLGLGAVAANAAFQEYSRPGRFNGAYSPLEYDVLRAGYLPMSELAYLLAIQAVVRDDDAPPGLSPPQRDEVTAWIARLRPRANELRTRLGLATASESPPLREPAIAFTDIELADDEPPPRKIAFRWTTHRGGIGFLAGAVVGVVVATLIAAMQSTIWIVMGTAAAGHLLGRSVRVPRCSNCASVIAGNAQQICGKCDAVLRGDIARLADRLEAEEQLEEEMRRPEATRADESTT